MLYMAVDYSVAVVGLLLVEHKSVAVVVAEAFVASSSTDVVYAFDDEEYMFVVSVALIWNSVEHSVELTEVVDVVSFDEVKVVVLNEQVVVELIY